MECAVSRVLGTYELLEMILLALPPRRVLVLQTVSKTWNTVIGSSKKFQQKLFLLPISDAVQPKLVTGEGFVESGTLPVYNNPISFNRIQRSIVGTPDEKGFVANFDLVIYDTTYRPTKSGSHGCLSWHDMFLTQPPCTIALVYVYAARHGKDQEGWEDVTQCSLRDRSGIKFDLLCKLVRSLTDPDIERIRVSTVMFMPVSQEMKDMWDEDNKETCLAAAAQADVEVSKGGGDEERAAAKS